jgi:hypothetical protein
MEAVAVSQETFEHFRKSFAYGSRTDLAFKFLKELGDEAAADFLQALLSVVGQASDDGDVGPLIDHVNAWQARAYAPRDGTAHGGTWVYDDGPFTPLGKSISDARVALFTSSGHSVEGQDPEPFGVKHMTQEEAIPRILEFLRSQPQLSVIPADTPNDRLRVRHPGYDIRGAQADPNVSFPLERLRELARERAVGELAAEAYSFVGAAAQARIIAESGPQWATLLKAHGVEAVVLVPV